MRAILTELDDALRENTRLMGALLQQQQYDEALSCMDERLVLIGRLVQLAQDEPEQQQSVAALAGELSLQEESTKALVATHHHAIFEQLTLFGRANKAGQAYRVNSKEF
ncbi:hypothetical protein ACW5W6_05205 [Aeromonas mytilicola]|uniref:hypothetical protein n=1 Tax=Aeromonas rivipollensis TaxID=948519 RepID=UPI003D1E68E5